MQNFESENGFLTDIHKGVKMQVQNISNVKSSNQNFQGKINIIPGDLSYLPAQYVRKAYNAMETQIKDKPFDLFIKQNHQDRSVSIIAQKEGDALKKNALRTEQILSDDADIYESVANLVIHEHEEKLAKQPKTFKEKLQNLADKVWRKFLRTMEIEDEVV